MCLSASLRRLSFAGPISDNKVLKSALSTVRFKGAHYVFDVGRRLPRVLIGLFAKSNGVVVKIGDASQSARRGPVVRQVSFSGKAY